MASILLTILGYVAAFILIGIAAVFMLYCLYIYHVHRKYAHLPQVPMPSFLGGHKKYIDMYNSSESDTMFHDIHKELGFPPLYVIFVLHIAMVIVVDPKSVKEVIFDNKHGKPYDFYRGFMRQFGQRFIGRGLLTEFNYDEWHKRRVILNTAFHRKYESICDVLRQRTLKEFMKPFNETTSLFINKLKEKADGNTEIKMLTHFNRCTLAVIAKVGLDLDLDIIENEDSTFNECVLTAMHGMIISGDIMTLFKSNFPSKARDEKRKVIQALQQLRDIGKRCVEKRIDDMNQGQDVPGDILTHIIKAGQEVNGDDKEKLETMIDEFVLFFVAGMDTTASLLSFTVIALGRHPEVLHRIMIEIEAVVGDKDYISYEDVNKLEYTMQVLKESLRLWPAVIGMSRQLASDIDVEGFKVPAGSNVNFNGFVMARMEKFFHNAHDFDPDRFKSDQDTMQYTYFPFALGPKSCIGQHFALIEARVILARFLTTFNFKLVPGQTFSLKTEITLKPKDGCRVFLSAK